MIIFWNLTFIFFHEYFIDHHSNLGSFSSKIRSGLFAIGRVGCGSSNSPNDWSIQLTIGRVGRGLSNLLDDRSDDGGFVVSMLGNRLFERLNYLFWGACRVILLKIRNFSFPYSYFLFSKVSRELSDIDFVVTDFNPNKILKNTWNKSRMADPSQSTVKENAYSQT